MGVTEQVGETPQDGRGPTRPLGLHETIDSDVEQRVVESLPNGIRGVVEQEQDSLRQRARRYLGVVRVGILVHGFRLALRPA